jgi:hypothetical protein
MAIKFTHLMAASVLVDKHIFWWRKPVDVEGITWYVAQIPKENPLTKVKFDDMMRDMGYPGVVNWIDGNEWLSAVDARHIDNDYKPSKLKMVTGKDIDSTTANKNEMLKALHAAGVVSMVLEFSGSGDSSNDDAYSYHKSPRTWYINDPRDWQIRNEAGPLPWAYAAEAGLSKEFERTTSTWLWDDLITGDGTDVVNNDGGGGDLTVDLSDPDSPSVLFTIYYNETISHDSKRDHPV